MDFENAELESIVKNLEQVHSHKKKKTEFLILYDFIKKNDISVNDVRKVVLNLCVKLKSDFRVLYASNIVSIIKEFSNKLNFVPMEQELYSMCIKGKVGDASSEEGRSIQMMKLYLISIFQRCDVFRHINESRVFEYMNILMGEHVKDSRKSDTSFFMFSLSIFIDCVLNNFKGQWPESKVYSALLYPYIRPLFKKKGGAPERMNMERVFITLKLRPHFKQFFELLDIKWIKEKNFLLLPSSSSETFLSLIQHFVQKEFLCSEIFNEYSSFFKLYPESPVVIQISQIIKDLMLGKSNEMIEKSKFSFFKNALITSTNDSKNNMIPAKLDPSKILKLRICLVNFMVTIMEEVETFSNFEHFFDFSFLRRMMILLFQSNKVLQTKKEQQQKEKNPKKNNKKQRRRNRKQQQLEEKQQKFSVREMSKQKNVLVFFLKKFWKQIGEKESSSDTLFQVLAFFSFNFPPKYLIFFYSNCFSNKFIFKRLLKKYQEVFSSIQQKEQQQKETKEEEKEANLKELKDLQMNQFSIEQFFEMFCRKKCPLYDFEFIKLLFINCFFVKTTQTKKEKRKPFFFEEDLVDNLSFSLKKRLLQILFTGLNKNEKMRVVFYEKCVHEILRPFLALKKEYKKKFGYSIINENEDEEDLDKEEKESIREEVQKRKILISLEKRLRSKLSKTEMKDDDDDEEENDESERRKIESLVFLVNVLILYQLKDAMIVDSFVLNDFIHFIYQRVFKASPASIPRKYLMNSPKGDEQEEEEEKEKKESSPVAIEVFVDLMIHLLSCDVDFKDLIGTGVLTFWVDEFTMEGIPHLFKDLMEELIFGMNNDEKVELESIISNDDQHNLEEEEREIIMEDEENEEEEEEGEETVEQILKDNAETIRKTNEFREELLNTDELNFFYNEFKDSDFNFAYDEYGSLFAMIRDDQYYNEEEERFKILGFRGNNNAQSSASMSIQQEMIQKIIKQLNEEFNETEEEVNLRILISIFSVLGDLVHIEHAHHQREQKKMSGKVLPPTGNQRIMCLIFFECLEVFFELFFSQLNNNTQIMNKTSTNLLRNPKIKQEFLNFLRFFSRNLDHRHSSSSSSLSYKDSRSLLMKQFGIGEYKRNKKQQKMTVAEIGEEKMILERGFNLLTFLFSEKPEERFHQEFIDSVYLILWNLGKEENKDYMKKYFVDHFFHAVHFAPKQQEGKKEESERKRIVRQFHESERRIQHVGFLNSVNSQLPLFFIDVLEQDIVLKYFENKKNKHSPYFSNLMKLKILEFFEYMFVKNQSFLQMFFVENHKYFKFLEILINLSNTSRKNKLFPPKKQEEEEEEKKEKMEEEETEEKEEEEEEEEEEDAVSKVRSNRAIERVSAKILQLWIQEGMKRRHRDGEGDEYFKFKKAQKLLSRSFEVFAHSKEKRSSKFMMANISKLYYELYEDDYLMKKFQEIKQEEYSRISGKKRKRNIENETEEDKEHQPKRKRRKWGGNNNQKKNNQGGGKNNKNNNNNRGNNKKRVFHKKKQQH